ncbi:hypothetical protein HK096_000622, partial [Nowakowskiella sp. JEL0078]
SENPNNHTRDSVATKNNLISFDDSEIKKRSGRVRQKLPDEEMQKLAEAAGIQLPISRQSSPSFSGSSSVSVSQSLSNSDVLSSSDDIVKTKEEMCGLAQEQHKTVGMILEGNDEDFELNIQDEKFEECADISARMEEDDQTIQGSENDSDESDCDLKLPSMWNNLEFDENPKFMPSPSTYFRAKSGKLGSLEGHSAPEERPLFNSPTFDENGRVIDTIPETPEFVVRFLYIGNNELVRQPLFLSPTSAGNRKYFTKEVVVQQEIPPPIPHSTEIFPSIPKKSTPTFIIILPTLSGSRQTIIFPSIFSGTLSQLTLILQNKSPKTAKITIIPVGKSYHNNANFGRPHALPDTLFEVERIPEKTEPYSTIEIEVKCKPLMEGKYTQRMHLKSNGFVVVLDFELTVESRIKPGSISRPTSRTARPLTPAIPRPLSRTNTFTARPPPPKRVPISHRPLTPIQPNINQVPVTRKRKLEQSLFLEIDSPHSTGMPPAIVDFGSVPFGHTVWRDLFVVNASPKQVWVNVITAGVFDVAEKKMKVAANSRVRIHVAFCAVKESYEEEVLLVRCGRENVKARLTGRGVLKRNRK